MYIVKLLLDMLKAGDQDISSDFEMSRLYGCRWNVVYSRSQVTDGMQGTPKIVWLCLDVNNLHLDFHYALFKSVLIM